jgi:processive 1,2-diacylglycerol beta-glucosyltransferase
MGTPCGEADARRILIITASMGAGHDGAARELARRLEGRRLHTDTVDFLALLPLRLGGLARWFYRVQLQHAAWTYELAYRLHRAAPRTMRAGTVRLTTLLAGRAVLRTVEATRPHAIVSTYPLSSLVLGRLRGKGRIAVPVATYLTDFAVHPLWVHPCVDLHLAVSDASAAAACDVGSRRSVATGPMVAPGADQPARRAAIRTALGVDEHTRVALVVAGSWGVGEIEDTVRDIEDGGDLHVVVVCGRDEVLQRRLLARGVRGTVIGWTDDMAGLMAAADVMVENAGGLTTMEAFASGLRVVSYRPIAGHGRHNASTMAASGVSTYARDQVELATALANDGPSEPAWIAMQTAGRNLFRADAAEHVVELAATAPQAVAASTGHPGTRRVMVAMAVAAVTFGMLTEGSEALATRGVGLAHPPASEPNSVYLGVRVDAAALRDAGVRASLAASHGSLVVDGRTADAVPHMIQLASAVGIDVENGGDGSRRIVPWTGASADCAGSATRIEQVTGTVPHALVTAHAPDAFHQLACRVGRHHQRIILARDAFTPTRPPRMIRPHGVYLLDASRSTPRATARAIRRFVRRARAADDHVRPLRRLQ